MAVPDGLIEAMTLAEKIGQLTMISADLAMIGPVVEADLAGGVRNGTVGSLFILHGRAAVHAAQRMALEETDLRVQLFFAFDVIHVFQTILPMPLGETCAFNPELWEETARLAATEAVAAGLDLTSAPMTDVSRRGRMAEGPGEDPLPARPIAEATSEVARFD